MPVTEIQRTELINRLVEVLGEERTETLMQCILPEGRDQLATKHDLRVLKDDLRVLKDDLKVLETTLRGEFRNELAKLRTEFAELRTEFAELKGEFAEHKAETKSGFAELRAYIDSALAKHTRHYTIMLIGFMVTIWATMIPLTLAT